MQSLSEDSYESDRSYSQYREFSNRGNLVGGKGYKGGRYLFEEVR